MPSAPSLNQNPDHQGREHNLRRLQKALPPTNDRGRRRRDHQSLGTDRDKVPGLTNRYCHPRRHPQHAHFGTGPRTKAPGHRFAPNSPPAARKTRGRQTTAALALGLSPPDSPSFSPPADHPARSFSGSARDRRAPNTPSSSTPRSGLARSFSVETRPTQDRRPLRQTGAVPQSRLDAHCRRWATRPFLCRCRSRPSGGWGTVNPPLRPRAVLTRTGPTGSPGETWMKGWHAGWPSRGARYPPSLHPSPLSRGI